MTEQQAIRRAALWAIAAIGSAALVMGTTWAVFSILTVSQTTQRTAEQVSDCLSPKGKCSEAAEQRSIETRKTIVFALTCIRDLPGAGEPEILACVDRALARDAAARKKVTNEKKERKR